MTLKLRDLKESNEFLNSVIDNINSGVFIVDVSLKIQEFNRALQTLFGKSEETVIGELCGNAMGCAFSIKEDRPCGMTSHCSQCMLRSSVVRTFTQKVPTYKQKLVREFYIGEKPFLKHFEYTTKFITFNGQEMILIIVDDITEGETQKLELMKKQHRIDEDLKAAAGIQQSLLPQKLPKIDSLEIAWKFLPCDAIGGDIFDVFRVDEDHLGCYMLDVSGHGVPSALVTVSVSHALQPSPPLYEVVRPKEVCEALDREYPFERFNNFFSIFYMVLNFRKGYCVYTNGGHPPSILLHRDGSLRLLDVGGPIIGLEGIMPFREEELELRRGDKIIFYTDGVLEHRNEQGEFYGKQRLHGILKELKDLPVDALLTELLDSVMEFGNHMKLRDDVSLLGIEFNGVQ
jgi:phosphoserine phosphatase RsbU/P